MSIATPNVTECITASVSEITSALQGAHERSLHMALVQLTNDQSLLTSGSLERERLIPLSLRIIEALRDADQSADKELPKADFVHRMMETMVQGNVPREYVPMMMQQMSLLNPVNKYRAPTALRPTDLRVAIIGAGMSGLLAAISLKEAGIPFVIYEKNAEVGGTWLENESMFPAIFIAILLHRIMIGLQIFHRVMNCWTTSSRLLLSTISGSTLTSRVMLHLSNMKRTGVGI